MSGLISISSSGGNGIKNNAPMIKNFRQDGKIGTDSFDIKYIAEDFEKTILRHYIYIDSIKKEITSDVGYEKPNNEFSYKVDNLKSGTKYQIYIEVTDGLDIVKSEIISITTSDVVTYGVRVDESNSNPSSCVTYIDDAVGINPANSTSLGGWSNVSPFNKIKLVGFKNGQETGDINPNNKLYYNNGSFVGYDVDIMVKIPKVYWKFTNISNGYELRISEKKINGSDCYAHKVGGVEKDYIYVGAYLGYVDGNKLRSRSGVSPTTSATLTNFRQYAHNVGNGYQQFNWFTLLLLQNLYLLAYKNLNSQQALGMGVCSFSSVLSTGGTNYKGMIFGSSNQGQQVCFLGIEDFYGNVWQWVDGMYCDGSYRLKVTPDNKVFNDNTVNFKNLGVFINSSEYGCLEKVAHTNESGFYPSKLKGSTSTYYCDYVMQYSGLCATFGGSHKNDLDNGAFSLNISKSEESLVNNLGSRLCYLG